MASYRGGHRKALPKWLKRKLWLRSREVPRGHPDRKHYADLLRQSRRK